MTTTEAMDILTMMITRNIPDDIEEDEFERLQEEAIKKACKALENYRFSCWVERFSVKGPSPDDGYSCAHCQHFTKTISQFCPSCGAIMTNFSKK